VSPREAVIDLDLLPAEPDRPRRPKVSWRWVLAVAVFALAGLLLTGAAAPPSPPLTPARTVTVGNAATFRLVGDALYVVEPRAGDQRLVAYPLTGGPPRWSVLLDMLARPPQMVAIGDVILVLSYDPGPVFRTHTEALDRRTGAVRWQSPLAVDALDLAHDRVLVADQVGTDRIDEDRGGDVASLAAATGERVWTYHRSPGCQPAIPASMSGTRSVLAVLCADGTLSAIDLDTGKVRATVPGTVQRPPNGLGFGIDVFALRDRILVTYPILGRSVFASFDAERLTPQWTISLEQGNYGVADCGPRLCLYSAAGGVQGLDRVTGLPRWHLGPASNAFPLDDRYVLAVLGANQSDLIDSTSGQQVLHLDDWTATPFRSGRPLFYRPEPRAGRMWVAMVSTNPTGLRVLGWVSNPNADVSDCVTSDGYFACRTVKDTIQVWRVRPPD
jgi:hypothetical protein